MTTDEMIAELRQMQGRSTFFGEAADRLEALASFVHEVATDTDDRVSPGFQNKARMIEGLKGKDGVST